MPVNTGITMGALQGAPQQRDPIQQLAALMQLMQAEKQGQLTDLELRQKQQAMPFQLAQLQAAADKEKRTADWRKGLPGFMEPAYPAQPAPWESNPEQHGPGYAAGPPVLNLNKALDSAAVQGVEAPWLEKLADHRAKLEQVKATREAAAAQRADALQTRLYQIDAMTQNGQLNREQKATLAAESNRIAEMQIEARREAAAARGRERVPPGYRPTADGNLEPIPGGPADFAQNKDARKLQAAMPQAELRMKSITQNMDRLATMAQELHDHPGLPNITGTVFGRTWDVSDEAIDAEAIRGTLTSNVWQSALQAMREASKTGGAVGSVSNREGDRLEASLGALSRVQTTGQFKKELKRVIDQVKMSKELIKEAFEQQFSEAKSNASPAGGGANKPYALKNSKGWNLMRDPVTGVRAYVGPNGQYEVVP